MMINEKLIKKIIDDNYSVLLAFDVADGVLSLKDFMKKIIKRGRNQKMHKV